MLIKNNNKFKKSFLKLRIKYFLNIYEKEQIINQQKEINTKLEKEYLNKIKILHNRYLNEIFNLRNKLNFYELK